MWGPDKGSSKHSAVKDSCLLLASQLLPPLGRFLPNAQDVDGKLKVTSEGIQEFINSDGDLSRPFTIVKYDAEVGKRGTSPIPRGP